MKSSLGFIPAEMDERAALMNFSQALGVAAAAAKQLAYMRNQTQWLGYEKALLDARDAGMALARTAPSRLII